MNLDVSPHPLYPLAVRSYDDYLALKDELKYSCYGFIAVIAVLIVFFAVINSFESLSDLPFVSLALWNVVVFWNFAMITLHTHWVIRRFEPVLRRRRYSDASFFSDVNKLKKHHSQNAVGSGWGRTKNGSKSNRHQSPQRVNTASSRPRDSSTSTQLSGPSKPFYKLAQILKHPKAYDLFMHHLWKEHSSECLLSCTEFVHFQYLIVWHHDVFCVNPHHDAIADLDILDDANANLVELHPDIPQSSIVFGVSPTNRVAEYIHNKLNPPIIPESLYKKHRIGSGRISGTLSAIAQHLISPLPPPPTKAIKIRHPRSSIKQQNQSTSAPAMTSRNSGTLSKLAGISNIGSIGSASKEIVSRHSITASQTMEINGHSRASAKAKRSTLGHAKSCSAVFQMNAAGSTMASRINLEQVNEPDLRMPSNYNYGDRIDLRMAGIAEEQHPAISSNSTDADSPEAVPLRERGLKMVMTMIEFSTLNVVKLWETALRGIL